jgi:hypothetical protein
METVISPAQMAEMMDLCLVGLQRRILKWSGRILGG